MAKWQRGDRKRRDISILDVKHEVVVEPDPEPPTVARPNRDLTPDTLPRPDDPKAPSGNGNGSSAPADADAPDQRRFEPDVTIGAELRGTHGAVPEPTAAEAAEARADAEGPVAESVDDSEDEQAPSRPIELGPVTESEPERVAVQPIALGPVTEPEPDLVEVAEPEPVVVPEVALVEVAETEPVEVPEPTLVEVAETESADVPEPALDAVADAGPVEVVESEPIVVAEPAVVDVAEPEPAVVPEVALEDAAEPAPANVPEPAVVDVAEPAVVDVAEPAVADVAEPAVVDVAEPAVEDVAEPALEDVAEPALEDVAEPALEDVAAPAVVDVAEPEPAAKVAAATGRRPRKRAHAKPSTYRGFPIDELVEDFRLACVSRALDDREITLQRQSRVFFEIAGAGHEALLLGLARVLRPGYDWFFPYYRDQALALGLGVTPREILLQAVGSADDSNSAGRQMPSHWGSKRLNIVTQSSPTGSQCLPAVGCAEASRYIAPRTLEGCTAYGDELTYVSLGEGATSEGEFWESLNTACRLHLPVLYVVADNGWAISVRASDQAPAPISELVRGFRGLAVSKVDGTDYFASREIGGAAVDGVRAGIGPVLLHATVPRPYSHSSQDTQAKYRSSEDLAEEALHDPIVRFEAELVEAEVLSADQASEIRAAARALVAEIGQEVLGAARPDPATVTDHVLALDAITGPAPPPPVTEPGAEPVGMGEAIRLTLHERMAADERVRVFGEDVADASEEILDEVEGKGGVFGTTRGLQREFGIARCYNTPLAEANIIGRGIGQALRGLRPCAEIQFFDYIWPATHQIRAEAATVRWRSNGQFTVPLIIRVAIGGYLTGGALWHSQSGESIFAHMPGLIVVFPSRAADAAGLLRTSFEAEDPVLFLEHKHLLRQKYAMDAMPSADYKLPFGRAATVRPGRDLTIVTWGATVQRSVEAAEQLAADGVELEVIDLRTILPWDHEAVAESIARTSRLLVVHEDVLTAGFGAEVAAWAGEHLFGDLDAPVSRVGAKDTFVAYEPTLERAILPQVEDIAAAAKKLADF